MPLVTNVDGLEVATVVPDGDGKPHDVGFKLTDGRRVTAAELRQMAKSREEIGIPQLDLGKALDKQRLREQRKRVLSVAQAASELQQQQPPPPSGPPAQPAAAAPPSPPQQPKSPLHASGPPDKASEPSTSDAAAAASKAKASPAGKLPLH